MLPTHQPRPDVVQAWLVARDVAASVAGTRAILKTYNGSFPGPVLRLHEGDRVQLALTNQLAEPTNLHLHGLRVSASIDDPFLSVAPGKSVVYEFTVPPGSAGTHWYHPHLHERVARQLFAGLAGPIVVTGAIDELPELKVADDRLLVLKDLSLAGDRPAPHTAADWVLGKEGDLVLVNGVVGPVLPATRSLLRLRLLNASNARYYRLALDDHPLHLIATDGGFLDRPVEMAEVLLAPGERAEVLIQLERAGTFDLVDLGYARSRMAMGMGRMGAGGRERTPRSTRLATIAVPTAFSSAALPAMLGKVSVLSPDQARSTRRLVLGEGMMGAWFSINGRPFDPRRVDLRGRLGTLEIWDVENRGRMDHPFHLHTYPFQILSRGGTPEPFAAWKDVVNVRPGEIVRLAVPLRDFTGRTVYHCHIAEHEDRGMMGVLEVSA